MAEVKANLVTKGISGMIGKALVFRQTDGKTYVSAAPNVSDREPTGGQLVHRQRFQEAIIYAKSAMVEPETKAAYQAEADKHHKHSAYAVAVADFFNAPDIRELILTDYNGIEGSKISVKVTDDFAVKQVDVALHHPDGTLIEQGNAEKMADGLTWVYTATAANQSVTGTRISVKTYDLPGNLSEKEETLT